MLLSILSVHGIPFSCTYNFNKSDENQFLVHTFKGNCPKGTKDMSCHCASYTSLFFVYYGNIYKHAEKMHWGIFHYMIHSCSYQNVHVAYIVNDTY